MTSKSRAFGIIEAIIASFIVIVVASAAVALSSSTLRVSLQDGNYFEAEHIAEEIIEEIYSAKAAGKLYFVEGQYGDSDVYPIDCFDTASRGSSGCPVGQPSLYSGIIIGDDGFVGGFPTQSNPSFSDDFFRWSVSVRAPAECRTSGGIDIPEGKCREVDVEVRWSEPTGDEDSYVLSQYFTDWAR